MCAADDMHFLTADVARRHVCWSVRQQGTVIMDSSFPSAYEAIIDKTKGLSVRTFMLANAVVGTTTAPAAVRA